MGDPRGSCGRGPGGGLGAPDDLRRRNEDGPLLHERRSGNCRGSFAHSPSLFNRAGDSERPMAGRKGIRGSGDLFRDHESRLRVDRHDQLWIALRPVETNPVNAFGQVIRALFDCEMQLNPLDGGWHATPL